MDSMEHVSDEVYVQAPWEFGDLRASGHPSVEHNGEVIHDRAPHTERLTEAELKVKKHLSHLFEPDRHNR